MSKVYIPTNMIKKTKSMARHNSDIAIDNEVTQDMDNLQKVLGNPMIDAIKSTVVTVAAIAVAYWGFYG